MSRAPPPPPPSAASSQASAPVRRGDMDEDASGDIDLGAELDRFEEMYMKECMKTRPNPTAKFNYAWALIRSKDRANIKKGVIMMQGLLEDRLLAVAPNCRQAISLLDIVEDRITKDGVIGISIVSGVALVAGLLAAVGLGGKSR